MLGSNGSGNHGSMVALNHMTANNVQYFFMSAQLLSTNTEKHSQFRQILCTFSWVSMTEGQ